MHRHLHLPNSQQKDSKASPYAPYKNPFPSRPAGSPIGTPQTGARHDSQRDYAGDQQQGSSQSRHTSQNHSRAPQQSGASAWGNGGAGGSQGFRTVAMPSTEGENERMSGGWGAPRPRKDFLETERQRASAVLAEERAEQAKTSQKDLDTKEATVRKQQLEQKKEKREREERKKAALAKKAAAPPAAPASASTSSIYGRLPSKLPAVRAAGDAAYRRQQEELKSSWERGATGGATKKDSKGKGRAKPVTILSDSDVEFAALSLQTRRLLTAPRHSSPKPSPVKRSGSNLAKKAAKRAKSSTVMVDIERCVLLPKEVCKQTLTYSKLAGSSIAQVVQIVQALHLLQTIHLLQNVRHVLVEEGRQGAESRSRRARRPRIGASTSQPRRADRRQAPGGSRRASSEARLAEPEEEGWRVHRRFGFRL